jgi:hypothetical protein
LFNKTRQIAASGNAKQGQMCPVVKKETPQLIFLVYPAKNHGKINNLIVDSSKIFCIFPSKGDMYFFSIHQIFCLRI